MKPFSVFFLAVILVVPISAQTPSVSEEIVVSASALPESVEDTPAAVSIITREQIEARAARDVADVLREVPGVLIARTGAPGKSATVFLRGGSSKQALVLWNGIEMNNPYLSGYNFGQLSTAGVEKIEVVRGPYSALYGSEAVSGVVNVLTTPQRSGFAVDVEAGENGLRNGVLSGALVGGRWTAHAALERRDDDGFAPNDDFGSDTILAGAQFAALPNLTLGVSARRNRYELGIPRNADSTFTKFIPSPQRRERGSETQVAVPVTYDAGSLKYELRLADSERTEDFADPLGAFGIENSATDSSTRSARFTVQTDRTAAGVITVGGEIERASVDHTDSFGLDVRSRSRDNKSVFIEDRLSFRAPGNARIEVALGARFDDFDEFGSRTSPRVALALMEKGRKWRAAYGVGFRAPAIGELYAPFFGNPSLDSESSRNVEAGFDQYVGSSVVSFTVFRSRYEGLIAFDATRNRFGNVDRARAEGVEVGASRRFGPLDAAVSYTRLRAVDESTDEQLLRRPKNAGSVSLGYDASPVSVQLVVMHTGARRDITDLFPFGAVTNEENTIADVTLRLERGGMTPFVKIENVTNERYEEVFGYPSAARRVVVGVRYAVH